MKLEKTVLSSRDVLTVSVRPSLMDLRTAVVLQEDKSHNMVASIQTVRNEPSRCATLQVSPSGSTPTCLNIQCRGWSDIVPFSQAICHLVFKDAAEA
jgi:hypothetical protein